MDFKITIDHPEQNKMEVMGGVTAPRCAQYGITFVSRVISKVRNINIKGIKTILILLYDVTKNYQKQLHCESSGNKRQPKFNNQGTSTYILREKLNNKYQDKLDLNKCARANSRSHLPDPIYNKKLLYNNLSTQYDSHGN